MRRLREQNIDESEWAASGKFEPAHTHQQQQHLMCREEKKWIIRRTMRWSRLLSSKKLIFNPAPKIDTFDLRFPFRFHPSSPCIYAEFKLIWPSLRWKAFLDFKIIMYPRRRWNLNSELDGKTTTKKKQPTLVKFMIELVSDIYAVKAQSLF